MELLTPEKLASLCTYGASVTEETVRFGKYKIEFIREDSPEAPHDRGGYMPPALWAFDSLCDDHGPAHRGILWDMSAADIAAQADTIRDILDISESTMQADSEWMRDGGDSDEWRKEYFAETLDNVRQYESAESYLQKLQALYNLKGIPAFLMKTHGYCQGDFARVLFVYTPEWAQKVGFPHAIPGAINLDGCRADAESSLKEFAAWAWGDVYGYSITRKGRDVDSCWGFYGSDPGESGIADAICESVNHDIERRAVKRAQRIADAIAESRPDLAPQWEGANA